MNGVWTIPENDALIGQAGIGETAPNTFGAFNDRCVELGMSPDFMLALPEESRKAFYDGDAVWLWFGCYGRMIHKDRMQVICEKGKALRKE